MKYYMSFGDYKDCFVDVSEVWTMKELKELASSDGDKYFEMFRKKVDGILVRDVNGLEIRDVNQLTEEFMENIDVAMAGFLGTVLVNHIRERRSLGGLSVRPSSTGSESINQKN